MSRNSRPSRTIFFIIGGVAVAIWLCVLAFGWKESGLPSDAPLAKLGLFGDMFGSINALFSALAMSGAIYAVILQSWQIQDQKQHDYDMLRRQKLEAILIKLESLSMTSVMVGGLLSKSFKAPYEKPQSQVALEISKIVIQYNEIRALVVLYFPTYIHNLLPEPIQILFDEAIDRARGIEQESLDPKVVESYLTELKALTMKYVETCSNCVSFAANNVPTILATT